MDASDIKILILGGTSDAIKMALELHKNGFCVVYSIAGLVRKPIMPCELVVGGFTQFGGLSQYLKDEKINAVLDVTHPFAKKMSIQAVKSAQETQIPCWRFNRLPWKRHPKDQWYEFSSWAELISNLKDKKSVFLTVGQLDQNSIDQLSEFKDQKQILRTAVELSMCIPDSMTWVKAIGPFNEINETQLMTKHAVDALVCKNSGGCATEAKLLVARKKRIPVFMHKRPVLPRADIEFTNINECLTFITHNKKLF